MWRGWPLCIPLLLTALMALGLLLAILSSSFSATTMTSAALHSALVPSKSTTAPFQRVLWPPLVRSVQRLTGLTSVYGTLWGARTASETSQNTLKMLGWRRYVGSSLRRATGAATAHVWRLTAIHESAWILMHARSFLWCLPLQGLGGSHTAEHLQGCGCTGVFPRGALPGGRGSGQRSLGDGVRLALWHGHQ